MEQAASQLLRAVRGRRSQVAFSRRLGYRGNPVADWEHGRSFPTAEEALRACAVAGLDVGAAFRRFSTPESPPPSAADTAALAGWLRALRGSTPLSEVAQRAGASRFAVSRWLAGSTRPRLPDFLRLLDALTRRVSEWVAALVPIEQVPALLDDHLRRAASRRLAQELPWSEAVVRLIETADYAALPAHRPGWLAERLGVDPGVEASTLAALEEVGVLSWDGRAYRASAPLTVDNRGAPERVLATKGHWAEVARSRLHAPRRLDLFSYNVVSLSRSDLERLRQLHLAYFRDLRSLVAASEPVECAALVNVQLVTFEPE